MPVSQIPLASAVSGTLPKSSAPSGSVIQTINNYVANSPEIATSSTNLVSSGISATITPTSASNLICVEFSSSMTDPASGGIVSVMYVNGSQMSGSSSYQVAYRDTNVRYAPSIFMGTFQPSNTSALTFTLYIRALSSNSGRLVHPDASYCLKLTEIRA